MRRLLLSPFIPLVGLSLLTTVLYCAYLLSRVAPSPLAQLIITTGWGIMVVLWMDADARRFRRLPCYDFGLLAAVSFPLSLFWYCLWSRGWRGVRMLLLLFGLWLAPYIIAVIFAVVRGVVSQ